MRNYIFIDELDKIKDRINKEREGLFFELKYKIFEESYFHRSSKILFVKDNFRGVKDIEVILKQFEISVLAISDILEIFEIKEDLEIPSELLNELLTGDVVLFVGAGASAGIGYPSWWQLANNALRKLVKDKRINHSSKKDIESNASDPKQILTIFESFYPKGSEEYNNFYQQEFKEKADSKETNEARKLYDLITDDAFGNSIITTNIDNEIEIAYKRKSDYISSVKKEDDKVSDDLKLQPPTYYYSVEQLPHNFSFDKQKQEIVYLHGHKDYPQNNVFSISDYAKKYFHKNSPIVDFLDSIFKNKTVLFIGYGLSEFAILETVIDSFGYKKHYTLEATFFNEIESVNYKRKTYEKLNINIIPYYRDFNDYNRLIEVLGEWKRVIDEKDFINDNSILTDAIKGDPEEKNIEQVISIIKTDSDQRSWFFRYLKNANWLFELENKELFNISAFPISNKEKALPKENLGWYQIIYLQEVANSLVDNYNSGIEQILISIVKDIVFSGFNNDWLDYRLSETIATLQHHNNISVDIIEKHLENQKLPSGDYFIAEKLLPAVLNSYDDDKKDLLINFVFGYKNYNDEKGTSVTNFDQSIVKMFLEDGKLTQDLNSNDTKSLLYKLIDISYPALRWLYDDYMVEFTIDGTEYILTSNFSSLYNVDFVVTSDDSEVIKYSVIDYHLKSEDEIKGEFNNSISEKIDQSNIETKAYLGDNDKLDYLVELLFKENFEASHFKLIKLDEEYFRDNVEVQLFMITLLVKNLKEKSKDEFKSVITELINSPKFNLPIFRRIAIYFISNNYVKLNELLWSKVEEYNLLDDYRYEDDIYNLLHNNFGIINEDHKEYLTSIIERGSKDKKFEDYWKFKWYSILKEDQKYSDKYNELKMKVGDDKDYKWQPSGVITFWGSTSPITVKDIISNSSMWIVNYLNNYKKKENDFRGPDEQGLADTLKESVSEAPEKFLKDFHLFLDVNNIYVNAITSKLENIVSPVFSKYIKSLVDFFDKYVASERFNYDKKEGDNEFIKVPGSWTVASILRLLTTIVKRDDVEIADIEILNSIKDFIPKLRVEVSQAYFGEDSNMESYIMFAINNNEGHLYQLLIELSLREGRLYQSKNEEWRYKEYFEDGFTNNIDSSNVIIGQYLRNFLWLDFNWTKSVISKLDPNSQNAKAFMGGYLYSNPIANEEVYPLLKPLYIHSIKNSVEKELEGIGSHIANLYFRDLVTLDEGDLIDLILEHNPKLIFKFFYVLLRAEDSIKKKEEGVILQSKITELILYINSRYDECTDVFCLEVLSYMYRFIVFFEELKPEITEAFIKISKKQILFVPQIIRHFSEHVEKDNSDNYANVLLEIWKNSEQIKTITFPNGHIFDIWNFIKSKLTNVNSKKDIRAICTIYVKSGDPRLEDFFKQLSDEI